MTAPYDPHDEWRDQAAAYALDALDAPERTTFEGHLATCEECRALVASYSRVVTSLGLAAEPVPPPPALRDQTLARAAGQPQLAKAATPSVIKPTAGATTASASAPAMTGPRWWLLAASLTLAAGLGIYTWSLRQEVSVLRAIADTASAEVQTVRAELAAVRRNSTRLVTEVAVLSAADLRRVDLAGKAGAATATGRAFVSQTHGLVFSAEHLPPLASGHVYQLWVLAPSPVSAGVFTPAPDGSATTTMPMPAAVSSTAIAAVAVTDEPNPQGSATPTMPILLVGTPGR